MTKEGIVEGIVKRVESISEGVPEWSAGIAKGIPKRAARCPRVLKRIKLITGGIALKPSHSAIGPRREKILLKLHEKVLSDFSG